MCNSILNDKIVDKHKKQRRLEESSKRSRKQTVFIARKGVLARLEVETQVEQIDAFEPRVEGGAEHLSGLTPAERSRLLSGTPVSCASDLAQSSSHATSLSTHEKVKFGASPKWKRKRQLPHKLSSHANPASCTASKEDMGREGHTSSKQIALSFIWDDGDND